MPEYTYYCPSCNNSITITHRMSECDNPSEDIVKNTICCNNRMLRKIGDVNFLSFGHGSYDKGGVKPITEKNKALRKRSNEHSKKVLKSDERSEEHTEQIKNAT